MPLFSKKVPVPPVSAVVVAAGTSNRMDGVDKQQLMLGDMPVVARSIGALSDCGRIGEIVVVCREECIADYYDMVRFYEFGKVISVVAGGRQRQDSVFAGIKACREDARMLAIHDGARPLILPWEIDQCIDAAMETGAAAVGVPVKDTIKVCDENAMIISTPNRDRLWMIQTPQIFEAALYKRAMAAAIHDNRVYTDDCQLVERAGHAVVISPGSYGNIKITTPEDIALATAILEFRQEEPEIWRR